MNLNPVTVTPTVIMYDYGNTDARVPIILSNVTTQTIKIPPRVTIAEIQPVRNETSKDERNENEPLQGINTLNIGADNLSKDQYDEFRKIPEIKMCLPGMQMI